MNKEEQIENALIEQIRKLEALEIENEALNRHTAEMLTEYKVTETQLTSYLANPAHFTESNWQTLVEEKKKIDTKLKRDLDNIVSPTLRKKRQKERHVQPHWLFVR